MKLWLGSYLLFLCVMYGCTGKKVMQTIVGDDKDCGTLATVRDYTGLDACRFLLELEDGTRLIPVELVNQDFLFSEGQTIKINYKPMKDVVTACLTSAMPVEVSCIQELKPGTKPGQEFLKRDCKEIEVPLTVSWMNKLIIRNKVSEVKKAYQGDQPFYAFYGNVYLTVYSCTGTEICESLISDTKSTCLAKLQHMEALKSIWVQK